LSADISRRQWTDGTAADVVTTSGTGYRDRLLRQGAPAGRVKVGGATRFDGFPNNPTQTATEQRKPLNFASCPIDPSAACELAHKTALATIGLKDVRVVINFHPDAAATDRQRVKQEIQSMGPHPHIEFSESSAGQWLNQASVVLYNSTGVAFSAA